MSPLLDPQQLQENQGPGLIVFFVIFSALPLIAVSLRVLSRRLTRTALWWDDWLLVTACAIEVVQLAFLIKAIQNGEGRHIQTVTQEQLEWYLIWTYASEIYYGIVVTIVKCSLLCLYLRLFHVNRILVRVCYGMFIFVVGWGISTTLTTIFQCIPVDAAWNLGVQRPSCINLRTWLIVNNVPNILADVIVILLPVPLVWRLKLSVARRIALIIIFSLAFITTIVSCLRVHATANINILDPTWGYIATAQYSTVEANIGIVTACLPVLAPVARMCIGRRPTISSHNDVSRGSRVTELSRDSARRFGGEPSPRRWNEDRDPLDSPMIHAAATQNPTDM